MTELDTGCFPSQLCMVTTRKHWCAALKRLPLLVINALNLWGCCQVCRQMSKIKWECFHVSWVTQVMLRENMGQNSNLKALNGSSCEEVAGWVLSTCRGQWACLGSSQCWYTSTISASTETGQLSPQASGRWQWHIFKKQTAAIGKRCRRLQGKNLFKHFS